MVVAAKESFVTVGRRRVRAGELFDDDHDLVKSTPELFEPFQNAVRGVDGAVETASASPGERRSVKKAAGGSA
jgi:hypothetical protein